MESTARSRRGQRLFLVLVAGGLLLLAGPLSLAASSRAATPAAGSATATETWDLYVYFLRDGKVGAARRALEVADKQVGNASLEAVLGGPTKTEEAAGLETGIPRGTELLDLKIDQESKVATVDLSGKLLEAPKSDDPDPAAEATMRLARLGQVVYTLTQFPSVTAVQIQVDGKPLTNADIPDLDQIPANPFNEPLDLSKPVTRAMLEPVTPAIFVETPAVGDAATNPLHVAGTSNVFEATSFIQILDEAGNVLTEQLVTATSGTGTRGTFDVTISYPAPEQGGIVLVSFERSAKDGSVINEVRIPLA